MAEYAQKSTQPIEKNASLMEQSGRLASQASELLEAVRSIESHLTGGELRGVNPTTGGTGAPVSPVLGSQLRDTSRTLSEAWEIANRIKSGIGI